MWGRNINLVPVGRLYFYEGSSIFQNSMAVVRTRHILPRSIIAAVVTGAHASFAVQVKRIHFRLAD
jgi:hypothetical protein